MAYEYGQYDFSTFKPLTDISTHVETGGAYLGPKKVEREWAKGEQAWESWLKSEMGKAPERYGEDQYNPNKTTKTWYRDQLDDYSRWRNEQQAKSSREQAGDQWNQWASQYENQMQSKWNEMSGRFDTAFSEMQQPKYYDIGGQHMTAEQAMNQFYKSGQRRDADFQQTISGMSQDWQRQFDDSRRGVTGQIQDLSKGWQRQFDDATYWANQQRRGVQGAATIRGLGNFRQGGSGLRGGMNREGMRITNLNV